MIKVDLIFVNHKINRMGNRDINRIFVFEFKQILIGDILLQLRMNAFDIKERYEKS